MSTSLTRYRHTMFAIALISILCLWGVGESRTWAWPSDPTLNVPIVTASGAQSSPQLVADGTGGTIVVWADQRGADTDIYAQRVSGDGTPLWNSNGVIVCSATGDQVVPQLVSDGASGAIVVWQDGRAGNQDLYAQRLNHLGVAQWTANGVAVCTQSGDQLAPQIASDGAGGAIVCWTDERGTDRDLYAQRLNGSGAPRWTANGVLVSGAADHQENPRMVEDGTGGALIAWEDWRNLLDADVYIQRVNSAGAPQWTSNGVALCTASGDQLFVQLASDGGQGALVTWHDWRGSDADVYAQRVNASGSVQWTANGVSVASATGHQLYPQLIGDGAGGGILTWEDWRNGSTNKDVYAQRLNGSGSPQWTANGVVVTAASGNQTLPFIVSDASGGAVIAWQDGRGSDADIYAQRLNAGGAPQWTSNGVAISTAGQDQTQPRALGDGAGGAVLVWEDNRSSNLDVYAQRVFADSSLPVVVATFSAIPTSDGLLLEWSPAGGEASVLGWNVYRQPEGTGRFRIINTREIPGHTSGEGYQYLDREVEPGNSYEYVLERVDLSGRTARSRPFVVVFPRMAGEISIETAVLQNFPNPFNPETFIPYQLERGADVTLEIFDVLGRLVRQIPIGWRPAGLYWDRATAIRWDGRDGEGERVASGIYFYRLYAGDERSPLKTMVVRK